METKINEITISIPYENREIVINGLIDNLIRVNHEGMPGDRVTIRCVYFLDTRDKHFQRSSYANVWNIKHKKNRLRSDEVLFFMNILTFYFLYDIIRLSITLFIRLHYFCMTLKGETR